MKNSLTEVGSLRAINQESCREYSIACCSQPDLKVGVEVHNFMAKSDSSSQVVGS